MKTGLTIWLQSNFGFMRDYLLPLPTADLMGTIDARAEYSDMSAMSRKLLTELRMPAWSTFTRSYITGDEPMLLPQAVALYPEHSERNWVNSLAAVLGTPKNERNFLGRWTASQSDDYLKQHVRWCTAFRVLWLGPFVQVTRGSQRWHRLWLLEHAWRRRR